MEHSVVSSSVAQPAQSPYFLFKDRMAGYEGRFLAMVLAGGRGERLRPLTNHRAKSAVPFGGTCRLIDFVLSNLVNSGINKIFILTQYKAQSLLHHLQKEWAITHPMNGYLVMPVPPSHMDSDNHWYLGTANAVFQNMGIIQRIKPDLVLIFGSDHIYTMDVRQMIRFHLERKADVTVAAVPMPIAQCGQFGTMGITPEWEVFRFQEKVPDPHPIPGSTGHALVSMGNYIFSTQVLLEELGKDASDPSSGHDFGRDILPKICKTRKVYAYDFRKNSINGTKMPPDYWRDVGTIRSFYQASMDLISPSSHLNIYNQEWPVRSIKYHDMPAKVMPDTSGQSGYAENSILGSSSIVCGGYVKNSVIGPNVRILSRARVEESVILGEVTVREGTKIRRAIIDHGNIIDAGQEIGYNPTEDARRYHLDDSGIVVIPHRYMIK